MSGVPVIWADNRQVVQLTFEKADYDELLSLLDSVENATKQDITPVEYHRNKI